MLTQKSQQTEIVGWGPSFGLKTQIIILTDPLLGLNERENHGEDKSGRIWAENTIFD